MPDWRFPAFGHGGDYNPDQWRHIPGTLKEDMRLMKLAGCNLMSVGIFSWAALVFLPPTLIAGIYGMNFEHMPELDWLYGYPMALTLIFVAAVVPIWYLKRRGWI